MLEYVCFDFSPFSDDIDKKVHSLREFLGFVDKQESLESLISVDFSLRLPKMWPVACVTSTARTLFIGT